MKMLFETDSHKNLMFNDLSTGTMIQSNQHLIVNSGKGMLLDPGGHKVYSQLLPQIASVIPINNLRYLFFSHQDPDILAAANGWLMTTDADAFLSILWIRFIPHFGVDELVVKRIKAIPDEGMTISLGGDPLMVVPAHFLHSAGNFQVYDPISKILYSGDLGASLGNLYDTVEDFDAHINYMEEFHKRYMPSTKALKMWVSTARTMDIEIIAPQHGAILPDKEMVNRFIDWIDTIACGVDLMDEFFIIPGNSQ
jgi:flavorubredoxin